ncbi:hypothetical protein BJ165DRAFT_1524913 [Panaeolus papilionaceus]|nr:hypothetical protein BJ165DRAFT_1524913 [Panaeolus papilionaceus]
MKLSPSSFLLSAVAIAAAMPGVIRPNLERELTISKDLTITPSNGTNIVARQNPGEVVSCYNVGTVADRATLLAFIDAFCGRIMGTTLERATITARFLSKTLIPLRSLIDAIFQQLTYNYGSFTVKLWGQAINEWTVDSNCNRLLRYPLDNCNTGTTVAKQGGYVTDRCGIWGIDPGSNGSDY